MSEIRNALADLLGEELTVRNVRSLFLPQNRHATMQVLVESVNLDRIERVVSTVYVTLVTCLAAGLSENAAKFGLGLNVSSVVSHSLLRLVKPMVPETQPLLGFFARATCASVGILAAFRLEKSLLVWANCLFGAELLVSAIQMILTGRRPNALVPAQPQTMGRVKATCVWTIAGAGLLMQVIPGNSMPFWVKGILLGPRMFEYGLQALSVSMKGSDNRAFFS